MRRFINTITVLAISAVWILGLLAALPNRAQAAVPSLINFQGVLRDAAGNPVANGSHTITFQIYPADAGGASLWSETQSVSTSAGLFAATLGINNAIAESVFDQADRWLGITVSPDPGELSPRQRLVSVGYSYRVATVDGATGGIISGGVSIQSELSIDRGINAKDMAPGTVTAGQPLVTLSLQRAPGQTTNMLEIKDEGGGLLGNFDPSGQLFARYALFGHTVHCDESLTVAGVASAPTLHLSGNAPSITIDNFPNPVPLSIKGKTGFLYVGHGSAVTIVQLDPVSPAPLLEAWRNSDGLDVATMDGSGNWEGGSLHPVDVNCDGDVTVGDKISFTAGTAMHEIGHTITIDHGGAQPPPGEFTVDVVGSVHATDFPTSSDARLKEDVRPIKDALDKIQRIRGVSFEWNDVYRKMGRSTGHREIGVIAQEVEKVLPELVTTWGEEHYRAVDYSRLSAVLIEAVKELKSQNEELQHRIEQLEKNAHQQGSGFSSTEASR